MDKIRHKLSRWKGKVLSIADMIYLIKSVITVLPLFYFFSLKLLSSFVIR